MEKLKVLIVAQELDPYLQLTKVAEMARKIPHHLYSKGMEIRILMPKFGTVNERRHRLHEVVRLSGINIIIANDDYPLLIKVASLPGARIQVYFLDNEDFFSRKGVFGDNEDTDFYEDNSERMIFFCKGVLETVKKFGWAPDFIFCFGWFTSLIPLYLKTAYKNEPIFTGSKVIYSVSSQESKHSLGENFLKKAPLIHKKVDPSELEFYNESTVIGLEKGAITKADALLINNHNLNGEIKELLGTINKPGIELEEGDDYPEMIREFILGLAESK